MEKFINTLRGKEYMVVFFGNLERVNIFTTDANNTISVLAGVVF
jgi:hypothetical protein